MRIKILGKYWKLKYTKKLPKDLDGCVDLPNVPNKEMWIDKDLTGKDELETIIHEVWHCADPHKDETFIEEVSKDLTNILWKLGYRKQEDQNGSKNTGN